MKRCVFLSCENLDGFVVDDELAIPAFERCGWTVDTRPWTDDCDWSAYRAALIRSTWDYTKRLPDFLKAMARVSEQTLLLNPLETVRWNARKTYLDELTRWGVPCIPTRFSWPENWGKLFEYWGVKKIMAKPQVAANADNTHIIELGASPASPLFEQDPVIQPFRDRILSEGEYSFHFFNDEFSHAVRKVPKSGDYRCQEEHGGDIQPLVPKREDIEQAQAVIAVQREHLKRRLLYSRVDMIRNPTGSLELIELELIEPSLYFRTHTQAAENFARAFEESICGKSIP